MGPSLAPYADTPRKVPREGNPKPRKVPVQERLCRPPTVLRPAAFFSARKRAGGSSCAPAGVTGWQKDRQCHSVLTPFLSPEDAQVHGGAFPFLRAKKWRFRARAPSEGPGDHLARRSGSEGAKGTS